MFKNIHACSYLLDFPKVLRLSGSRSRKSIFFLSAFYCLLSTTIAHAQVATLDSKKIMATMPVFQKIDTLVQEESMKYSAEYRSKLELTQKLSDSARRFSESLNTSRKSQDFREVSEKAEKATADFKQYEQKVMKKIEEYKALILSPYYEKINKAIKAVALRLKYKQVMDIQSVSFAYLDPSADITEDVIKEMRVN